MKKVLKVVAYATISTVAVCGFAGSIYCAINGQLEGVIAFLMLGLIGAYEAQEEYWK